MEACEIEDITITDACMKLAIEQVSKPDIYQPNVKDIGRL